MAKKKIELSRSTTLIFSDEALKAEAEVVDRLNVKTSRIARYEMAILALAQILRAQAKNQTIDPDEIDLQELP